MSTVGMLAGAVGAMVVVLIGLVVAVLADRARYFFLIVGGVFVLLLVFLIVHWDEVQW